MHDCIHKVEELNFMSCVMEEINNSNKYFEELDHDLVDSTKLYGGLKKAIKSFDKTYKEVFDIKDEKKNKKDQLKEMENLMTDCGIH